MPRNRNTAATAADAIGPFWQRALKTYGEAAAKAAGERLADGSADSFAANAYARLLELVPGVSTATVNAAISPAIAALIQGTFITERIAKVLGLKADSADALAELGNQWLDEGLAGYMNRIAGLQNETDPKKVGRELMAEADKSQREILGKARASSSPLVVLCKFDRGAMLIHRNECTKVTGADASLTVLQALQSGGDLAHQCRGCEFFPAFRGSLNDVRGTLSPLERWQWDKLLESLGPKDMQAVERAGEAKTLITARKMRAVLEAPSDAGKKARLFALVGITPAAADKVSGVVSGIIAEAEKWVAELRSSDPKKRQEFSGLMDRVERKAQRAADYLQGKK